MKARAPLAAWALAMVVTAIGFAYSPIAGKACATVAFILIPSMVAGSLGFENRLAGLRLGLAVSLIVLPIYAAGWLAWVALFPWVVAHVPFTVPEAWRGVEPVFALRLPPNFALFALDTFLVVALPEELFYRGYLQTKLREAWPRGRMFLGARLGAAFWVTAVLFALGHLVQRQPWRLGVFFPALLFGWMRERTNSLTGAMLFHGLANLTAAILEASTFGQLSGHS